jgi:PAS domain S-box-containing protein
VGAVDERVPVAAVARIEQLAETIVTRRRVGRNQRLAPSCLARSDPEVGVTERLDRSSLDRVDLGERRRVLDERLREAFDRRLVTFHLDQHAVAVVQDEAAEVIVAGDPIDEGAEAHPLHDSLDDESPASHGPDCRDSGLHAAGVRTICLGRWGTPFVGQLMQRPSALDGGDLRRLVVDNITELVALVDMEWTVLYASAAYEQKLGFAVEEIVGGALTSLIHPDDLERVSSAFAGCATHGRAQLGEFRMRHRDGRWLVLDGGLAAIDAGETELLLVTARDVTERALRERSEREFVANAAHELLTPLTAMTAAIEVLQSGAKEVPAERDAFLDDLEREVDRLGRLAHAMLVLARVQATAEPLLVQPVELCPLLRDVAESLRVEAEVEVDVVCGEAVLALAERDLLERALTNLAENAAAHTRRGSIVLSAESRGDGCVAIEVLDSGSGMPPEQRDRVFERFSRGGSRGGEGFGLGLAIVREAVRVLDGTVEIESEPGIGTVVRLSLPEACA